MSKFDNSVVNPRCGEYTITNLTGSDDTLIVQEIIGNTLTGYTYKPVSNEILPSTDSTTIYLEEGKVYQVNYFTDDTDLLILTNNCGIDKCIIKYISDIMCCDSCNECSDLCNDMLVIKNYIAVALLYEVLQDLYVTHFGGIAPFYITILDELDKVYTMYELVQKINELCTCKAC